MVIARQPGVLQTDNERAVLPCLRSVIRDSDDTGPHCPQVSSWGHMSRWTTRLTGGRARVGEHVSQYKRATRRVRFELPNDNNNNEEEEEEEGNRKCDNDSDNASDTCSDSDEGNTYEGPLYVRGKVPASSGRRPDPRGTLKPLRSLADTSVTRVQPHKRIHTTGKYVRGTLPPTSTVAPQPAADRTHQSRGVTANHVALGDSPWGPRPGRADSRTSPHALVGQLLRAARDNEETILRDILRRAAIVGLTDSELNGVDCSGRTPISYICANGSVAALEALLQVPGVDINLPDNEGNTPLHYAAQAGQIECLNMLIGRGRSLQVDARNHLGFTALMKAALQGRTKCAKLLLFAGASPTLRDCGRGLRAEQWARFCGRYTCAETIEKFARHRLLERTTSSGRWGSEPDVANRLLSASRGVQGQTPPPQSSGGFRSKFRKVFRTSSGPHNVLDSPSSARLVTQLTSAALCASTPGLPSGSSTPGLVKSLIRPLQVPKVQVTLVNNGEVLHNLNPVVTRSQICQPEHEKMTSKPPVKTKKKK